LLLILKLGGASQYETKNKGRKKKKAWKEHCPLQAILQSQGKIKTGYFVQNKTKPDQENTLMIQECLEEKCKVSRVRMEVSTRTVPEVTSPILLCWPTTPEADVGGVVLQVEPSYQ